MNTARTRSTLAAALLVAAVACTSSSSPPAPGGSAGSAAPAAGIPTGPGGITNAAGPYPVVELVDATTLTIQRGRDGGLTTVRLLGAVAPDATVEARCYGAEAVDEAHRLLDGQAVRVVGDPAGPRSDAEGLPLVYAWLDSGRMANELLIEGGYAREATGTTAYLYRSGFARSEELARSGVRGLWSPSTCNGNLTKPGR